MSALRIAVAGLIALAVAMGIGRFAFTPILPMMLHDGVVDLHAASWLASANYLGYLAGALLCTFQPRIWAFWPRLPALDATVLVRAGLAMTAVLTLGMAAPVPALWPALRFLAGITSAMVFVYSSGWCLAQVAARGQPALGGAMFAGPGAGIVASGLLASGLVALNGTAATAWLVFAVLALGLSASVWGVFDRRHERSDTPTDAAVAAATAPASATAEPGAATTRVGAGSEHGSAEVMTLAVAYGIAGFGYIVTATFLPVIARAALPGSPWLDLFWPIFGAGVIVGALLASRLRVTVDLRLLLVAAYVVQALGIGIGVATPTAPGFALGSLLLGLPFTAITFFAMQEVRRLRPGRVASTIGLATAIYGIGQIIGPPMVGVLLRRGGDVHAAFTLSLVIAAAALLAGALIFFASTLLWPLPRVAAA